jgi:hypothetical protein
MTLSVVSIHKRKRPSSFDESNTKKQKGDGEAIDIKDIFDEYDDSDQHVGADYHPHRIQGNSSKTLSENFKMKPMDKRKISIQIKTNNIMEANNARDKPSEGDIDKSNLKSTCYLCHLHDKIDEACFDSTSAFEEFINMAVQDYYSAPKEEGTLEQSELPDLSSKKHDSLNDLIASPMRRLFDKPIRLDHYELEPKLNILAPLQVSLTIKLYATQFSLEMQTTDATNSNSIQNRNPAIIKYNQATRTFLKEIAANRLVPELLEEISDLNQLKFYDGSIVVEVIDMREQELMQKMNQQQEQMQIEQRVHQGTGSQLASARNEKKKQPITGEDKSKEESASGSSSTSPDNSLIPKTNKCTLLLKPEPEFILKDINHFIEENFPKEELNNDQRLEILQRIMHATHTELCLSPNPEGVIKVSNILYNDKQKARFRRRKRSLIHTEVSNLTNIMSSTTGAMLPAASQANRKFDHSLINYILSSSKNGDWKTAASTSSDIDNILSPNGKAKRKQKVSSKHKKQYFANVFPRNPQNEMTPVTFLQKTEQIMINNKNLARTRTLKFQTTHDKNKIWTIRIIPLDIQGRKYEATIIPPGEQGTSCNIGGKHETELYVRRLKDMFTSNGKTKLVVDQESDVSLIYNQPGQQVINGRSNIILNPSVSRPGQGQAVRAGQQAPTTQQAAARNQNVQPIVAPGIDTALLSGQVMTNIPRQQPAISGAASVKELASQSNGSTGATAARKTPTNTIQQPISGTRNNTPTPTTMLNPNPNMFPPNLQHYNLTQFPASVAGMPNISNLSGSLGYPLLATAAGGRMPATSPVARTNASTPAAINPANIRNYLAQQPYLNFMQNGAGNPNANSITLQPHQYQQLLAMQQRNAANQANKK